MGQKIFVYWFMIVSTLLVIFGLTYTFLGLKILPANPAVLVAWESALYGAMMTGWGVMLLLIGPTAFRRNDIELSRATIYGLAVWLILEAVMSTYLHVWFNVGVDAAVLFLFTFPLLKGIGTRHQ
jgi:hypothetical protein